MLVASFDPHDTAAAARPPSANPRPLRPPGHRRRLALPDRRRRLHQTPHPGGRVPLLLRHPGAAVRPSCWHRGADAAGRCPRYLYGIEFPSRNVRLGLVEAANNRIGSPIDQVLLYCFHYDPARQVQRRDPQHRPPQRDSVRGGPGPDDRCCGATSTRTPTPRNCLICGRSSRFPGGSHAGRPRGRRRLGSGWRSVSSSRC